MGIKRFLAIAMLCLCFVVTTEAQKAATVKSFTQTTDHVPVNNRRSDFNGKPCALVKVQVVDQIERVEGNKIGDVVDHGVEKWVYMCKGSRNMRIHLKNHLPVKVMFQNYHINGLESNKVYELVLNIPDAPTPTLPEPEIPRGTFTLNITPQTATVTIWGDNMLGQIHHPEDNGSLMAVLPYGRYYYTVKAEGYKDFEGNFFVSDNNQTVKVNLSPTITENLYISCPTTNVDFFIDGNKVNKLKSATEWFGQVSIGMHKVEVMRRDYVTQSHTVNVPVNQIVYVTFDFLKSKKELKAEQKRMEKENKKLTKAQKKTKPTSVKHKQKARQDYSSTSSTMMSFGIRAGIDLASLAVSDGSSSMTTGFHVGPSVDFRISNSLYLNTALLFSQKGYKYEVNDIKFGDYWYDLSETATAQFISLPIQLSYRIGNFQINAGPYLDYGIGGEIDCDYFPDTHTFDHYDALNYGVIAGVGLTVGRHFNISANYELGFSNYANRNIAISLGYIF